MQSFPWSSSGQLSSAARFSRLLSGFRVSLRVEFGVWGLGFSTFLLSLSFLLLFEGAEISADLDPVRFGYRFLTVDLCVCGATWHQCGFCTPVTIDTTHFAFCCDDDDDADDGQKVAC